MAVQLRFIIKQMKTFSIDTEKASHQYEFQNIKVHSPYPLYEGQKQYISYVIECLNKGQNGLAQSPTGTGKTLSLLLSSLSWIHHQMKTHKKYHRIIYASRTHSQLKQVVKQLKNTGYNPKIAILGSKDQTCLNQQLKQLSGNSKQLECRLRISKKFNRFCKYFHYEDYYEKMPEIGKIKDLQEISANGKVECFCPFFYEKKAKQIANLILMPYNYIFDKKLWDEEAGSIAQNSIIIFDEAHNIQSVCEQAKQISLNLSVLMKGVQHISELREQKLRQIKNNKEQQIKSTVQEIQIHASYLCLVHAHFQTVDLPSDENGILWDVSHLLQFLNRGTEEGQFGRISQNINKLCECIPTIKNDIIFKPYWALDLWFNFILRLSQLFKQNQLKDFKCQISYQGSDIKINIFCLNPQMGFKKVQQLRPKSILITSGTLSPLNTWPLQLGVKFAKPLACPHILQKDQVNGCILTEGPNKVRLNFSFQNRNKQQIYRQLGNILIEIATQTPNGVLVFFPSYALLQKVKIQLGNVNLLHKIYEKKMIFFQKKNTTDFKLDFDNFLKEAVKPKGAMFFALTRGKISEGLDFSNQKCRAVVVVGVPYPNSKDVKVLAKRSFLDSREYEQKSISGDQWYLCETIRSINQSIGRIIRNKEDFGSIYLLDERFKKKQLLNQISSWARESLKIIDDYADFSLKAKIFNEYFMKKKDNVQPEHYFTSQLGTKIGSLQPTRKLIKGSISETTIKDVPSVNINEKFSSPEGEVKSSNKNEKMDEEKQKRQKIIFSRPSKKILIDDKKECQICRELKKLIKNSQCVHELCESCWTVWLKKDLRCPICRVRVRQKFLIK